jgi:hypothetical protein
VVAGALAGFSPAAAAWAPAVVAAPSAAIASVVAALAPVVPLVPAVATTCNGVTGAITAATALAVSAAAAAALASACCPSGLALGSGVVVGVVPVDVDTVLPASAAAILASSAASTGSTVVSVAAVGVVEASSLADVAAVPLVESDWVLVLLLALVVAEGAELLEADDGAGAVEGDEDEVDGADDALADAGAGAGACAGEGGGAGGAGAGGGLGGAAASIRAENGVWGTVLGAEGVGDEKLGCRLDGGGGAGDATADTKVTSKSRTDADQPAIAGPAGRSEKELFRQ